MQQTLAICNVFLVEAEIISYRDKTYCGPFGRNFQSYFCGDDASAINCPRTLVTAMCPTFTATLTRLEDDTFVLDGCHYEYYSVFTCGK